METELYHDLSESNIVFIHASLDDAELSWIAFRVYAHIARRTLHSRRPDLWPSVTSIGQTCGMNEKTVWRALNELIQRGMIIRESRPGKTSKHVLTKPSTWLPKTPSTHSTERVDPPDGSTQTVERHPTQMVGRHPLHQMGHEVYPKKEILRRSCEGSIDPPREQGGADAQTSTSETVQVPSEPPAGTAEKNARKPKAPAKPRARNLAFDALAELDGWQPGGELTKSEAGRVVAALDSIRKAWPPLPDDATPEMRLADQARMADEIRARARRYTGEIFPHAPLTSTALAAHWTRCRPPRPISMPGCEPATGGKYPLPAGCDYHAIGRSLGLRILPEVPWHELGHSTRARIIEAFTAQTVA